MESLTWSGLVWCVVLLLALGTTFGITITWWRLRRSYVKEVAEQIADSRFREEELFKHLRHQESVWQERLDSTRDSYQKMNDSFRILSDEFIRDTRDSFDDLAEAAFSKQADQTLLEYGRRYEAISEMLVPMQNLLSSIESRLSHVEESESYEYAQLRRQVSALMESQESLAKQTDLVMKESRGPRKPQRTLSIYESKNREQENQLPPRRNQRKSGEAPSTSAPEIRPLNGREDLRSQIRKIGKGEPPTSENSPGRKDTREDSIDSPADSILPFRDLGNGK